MEDLKDFYTSQREKHRHELQQVKKRLGLLATLRLSVFVAMALGVYFFGATRCYLCCYPLD